MSLSPWSALSHGNAGDLVRATMEASAYWFKPNLAVMSTTPQFQEGKLVAPAGGGYTDSKRTPIHTADEDSTPSGSCPFSAGVHTEAGGVYRWHAAATAGHCVGMETSADFAGNSQGEVLLNNTFIEVMSSGMIVRDEDVPSMTFEDGASDIIVSGLNIHDSRARARKAIEVGAVHSDVSMQRREYAAT